MSVYDEADYGLRLPQPYLASWPEELPRNSTNPALASSLVAMEGQGRLIGFTVSNTKASAQFILLFDSNALPADGAVPRMSFSVPASDAKAVYFGSSGRWFHQGIILCNSSTQGTKTIGSADCIFDVQFVPQVI